MIRGLLVLTLIGGCDPTLPTPLRCKAGCLADPRPHCVADEGCASDADCPSGLTCDALAPPDTACQPPSKTSCRWKPPRIDRLALVEGFATRTMDLTFEPPKRELAWTNPPGAVAVACAVFTCNPVVNARDVHDEADEPVSLSGSSGPLRVIANADACMIELNVTDTSRTTLPLDGSLLDAPSPVCDTDLSYHPVVDFVAAACWEYDEYHIVAASELIPIDPAMVAPVFPTLPTAAPCVTDGVACLAGDGYFGACFASVCQPRCASPQDCELAARQYTMTTATTCDWECRHIPDSVVGVCAPRS